MYLSRFRESLFTSSLRRSFPLCLEKPLMHILRWHPVPKHLALVMDGNRRFAKNHNISITEGHILGVENLELCYTCEIRVVTIYVFSIENFKRPKAQVDELMKLFKAFLDFLSEPGGILSRHGVAMRVLGRLELLEPDMVSTIHRTTHLTRDYGEKILNVCLSYTSRDEIASAIRQTVADCKIQADNSRSNLVRDSSIKRHICVSSTSTTPDRFVESSVGTGEPIIISPRNITSKTLADRMLTAGDPALDLLIRTSGARRLSDYLLWQCHEDTHILFPETLWPNFGFWQFFTSVRRWQHEKRKLVNENRKKRLLDHSIHAALHWTVPLVSHHKKFLSIQRDIKALLRLPEHLSVIVSLQKEENALDKLIDQVAALTAWSACARIPTLSIYEKSGILKSHIPKLYQAITKNLSLYCESISNQPDICIFTPHHGFYRPPQVYPASERPSSVVMNLLLLSDTDGRESLVDLTKSLANMSQRGELPLDSINIELINTKIKEITLQRSQSKSDLTNNIHTGHYCSDHAFRDRRSSLLCSMKMEPDLLMIFGPYIKLDGYPPWQIRLTEIFCTGCRSSSVAYHNKLPMYEKFLRGLYQYSGAEMRFGT